jgi:hypothetical protein
MAAAVGTAGLFTVSCSSPKPCLGVSVGDRLTVTVVDTDNYAGLNYDAGLQDAGPQAMCGFGLDVAKGETLMATAEANVTDEVDVAPFNGWTWTLDTSMPQLANNTDLLNGNYRVSNGACIGTATIDVFLLSQGGGDPFATYVPGRSPTVLMQRVFTGSGAAGCPSRCSDYYIVNVKRA